MPETVAPLLGEVPIPPAAESDELSGILNKYESDPRKIAKAYKDLQSHTDSTIAKFAVPNEYNIKTDFSALGDEAKKQILEIAKTGKFTQAQLDILAEKTNANALDFKGKLDHITQKRNETLGNDEEVMKLKAFYSGKMPDEALEFIIKHGDPVTIQQMKATRDQSLNKTNQLPLGDTMTTPPASTQELVNSKRTELRNLVKERRTAPMEQHMHIDHKVNRLGDEIAKLIENSGGQVY